MNFTNSELIHLISMTCVGLTDSKHTIKRQEKIIKDHLDHKDDPKIIEHSKHTLKLLKKNHKENVFLKEKLLKQYELQEGKEVFI